MTEAVVAKIHNPVTTHQEDSTTGFPVAQKSVAGASQVDIASGMDTRGNYPATWYLNNTNSGAAAGTFYTSVDVSMYNRFTMELSGLTATSVDVYASVDGTNFSAIIMFDAATGAPFATAAITANGMYYIDAKYKVLRVDQVGAGAATIRYSHAVI